MQMFLALIAAVTAAFAGGGIAYGLRKLSKERLPKWITPVGAGLAMLATTVSLEYTWARGVMATLPEGTQMVATREQKAWYQPWTFVQPWIKGFVAVNPADIVETVDGSNIFAVQTLIYERWSPAMIRPVLVDCAQSQRAELDPSITFDADGLPQNATWLPVGQDDPLVRATC